MSIHSCCTEVNRSHCSVLYKTEKKISVFVRSHDLPDEKNAAKNIYFCAFTLICLITKTQRKTSVFVRSHCSVFVKPIVEYWSVFKNLRFCVFTLIWSVFENLRFCGVFVEISVNTSLDICNLFHEQILNNLCSENLWKNFQR